MTSPPMSSPRSAEDALFGIPPLTLVASKRKKKQNPTPFSPPPSGGRQLPCRRQRESRPNSLFFVQAGPPPVGQWEFVRRHRALCCAVELRIPVTRGLRPYAPAELNWSFRRRRDEAADAPSSGSRVSPPLEHHATPADDESWCCLTCCFPSCPRLSVVKQRYHVEMQKRPTWHLAQVGRVVPLRPWWRVR